jgi:hypothetical protein
MPEPGSVFSEKSQRALMWWGLVLGGIWAIAMVFMINILPPPTAQWPPARIAEFYRDNNLQIRWGAVISSWSSGFLMPILAVVAVQMARVETGGARIWTAVSLVSGAMMTLFLVLPPIFFGVAAFSPGRNAEITSTMHELGILTMVTTDQYYIFMWVGVTVIALRTATQFVENNPFPRWWGYLSLWITLMLEAGAFAFVPRTGPLAWNGLLVFWTPMALFSLWILVQSWLVFRALRGQEAAKRHTNEQDAQVDLNAFA